MEIELKSPVGLSPVNRLRSIQSVLWQEAPGYTLIELLISVSIVGILASIAVPRFADMKTRSTIAATKQNVNVLANAAQLFEMDRNRYPSSVRYDSQYDLAPLCDGASYIRDVQIPDPFQRIVESPHLETSQNSNAGLSDGTDVRQHGFIYVNYQDFLGQEFSRYQGIGIYSIGPDRHDSWLSLYPLPSPTQNLIRRQLYGVYGESALQPAIVFNPSNGVQSEGDFGAFRGEFNGFIPSDL